MLNIILNMNIIKYLKKVGFNFSIDMNDFVFTKNNKSVYINKKELEQYLFIKLLEYVENEYNSK